MNNLFIALTIIAAYMLGHYSGYSMHKLRVRNRMRKYLHAVSSNPIMKVTEIYETMMKDLESI